MGTLPLMMEKGFLGILPVKEHRYHYRFPVLVFVITVVLQIQVISCSGGLSPARPYLFRDYEMLASYGRQPGSARDNPMASLFAHQKSAGLPSAPITSAEDDDVGGSSEEEPQYDGPLILDIDDPEERARWMGFNEQESNEEDYDDEQSSLSSSEFMSRSSQQTRSSGSNKQQSSDSRSGEPEGKSEEMSDKRTIMQTFTSFNPLSYFGEEAADDTGQLVTLQNNDIVSEYAYYPYTYESTPSSGYVYSPTDMEQYDETKPSQMTMQQMVPMQMVQMPQSPYMMTQMPKPEAYGHKKKKAKKATKAKKKKMKKMKKAKKKGMMPAPAPMMMGWPQQYVQTIVLRKPDKLSLISQKLSKLNPFNYIQIQKPQIQIKKIMDGPPPGMPMMPMMPAMPAMPPPTKMKKRKPPKMKKKKMKKPKPPKPPKPPKVKKVKPAPPPPTPFKKPKAKPKPAAPPAPKPFKKPPAPKPKPKIKTKAPPPPKVKPFKKKPKKPMEEYQATSQEYVANNMGQTQAYSSDDAVEEEQETEQTEAVEEEEVEETETDGYADYRQEEYEEEEEEGAADNDEEYEEDGETVADQEEDDDDDAESSQVSSDETNSGEQDTDAASGETVEVTDADDTQSATAAQEVDEQGDQEESRDDGTGVEDDEGDYEDSVIGLTKEPIRSPESSSNTRLEGFESKEKSLGISRLFGWGKKKKKKKKKRARRPPGWKHYRPAPLIPDEPFQGISDTILRVVKHVGFLPEYDKTEKYGGHNKIKGKFTKTRPITLHHGLLTEVLRRR